MTSCAQVEGFEHCASLTIFAPASTIRIAFSVPANDQVKHAFANLRLVGLIDVRAVKQGTRTQPDRTVERDVGHGQGGRRAQHGVHVGQMIHVGRQRHGEDLDLVADALVEQGAQRAVNQTAGQDRPFRRAGRRA
jgi:hypothetical protein